MTLFYFSPQQIFKRKFGFELPKNAQIVDNQFDYFEEQTLLMKVSFGENEYPQIIMGLQRYFNDPSNLIIDKKENYINERVKVPPNWNEDHPNAVYKTVLIPAVGETHSWWDFKEDEIILGYSAFRDGVRAKTREVYAFITRDSSGQYYLYVMN